jgi:hypothetical protein
MKGRYVMVRVSEKIVEDRVRRALRREGEVLRKTRPGNTWARADFGDYYTVDPHTRFPERRHCDLTQLARECGVLRPGEVIAE